MILWFFQRYATFVAVIVSILVTRRIVPEETQLWIQITVCVAIVVVVYLLLYKDGVTANRRKREPNNPFR